LTHPDDDRPLLESASRDLGVDATWVAWDDSAIDWSQFSAVVIRSTWDYHHRQDEYLAWVDHVSTRSLLMNPAPVVHWNHHKGYLLDLIRAGVKVVPTTVFEQGSTVSLRALSDETGWDELVVKPAVSAGAKATRRVRADDMHAERRVAGLVEDGDVLVQPYVANIEAQGETSLVVAAGRVTHAVRKRPAPGDFRVQEQFGGHEQPVEPTGSERALVESVMAIAGEIGDLLYARIDCVTKDAEAMLMELELIEPSLYLRHGPTSTPERLVAAVLERV
jgi:glutathione synthase/RimK-type ligase-like ATP-grasp enzyme